MGDRGASASGTTGADGRLARQRFFHNYNRAIATAYGGLLVGLAAFFAFQLQQALQAEIVFIQARVERHGQFLEQVLRASTDQLESLRMAVAADLASGRACEAGHAGAAALQRAGGGFDRDGLADRDTGGNLRGDGALAGREPAFYCDLGAALGLDNQFAAMAFHLPNAARARFVSPQGFYLQAPWLPAASLPVPEQLYAEPAWREGQPAANPDRLKYWAPPYFGGEDSGLLAPVAAPAYDGERFVGVVTIDMSLDYLNRVNSSFDYPLGTVSVIDAAGRVLADPRLYRDPLALREPGVFQQAFPPAVVGGPAALRTLPAGVATAVDDWFFIRRPFLSAPWQLVYAVPRAALWERLLRERGPALAAVLLALLLLMALTYAVTLREFVGPAAKLVTHVERQLDTAAAGVPAPVPPRVPAAWQPWFDAITRAFRASEQLGSLRRDMEIAARLQQSLLPQAWPQDPRFTLLGVMQPAKDIGGDFYDHYPLAGGACGFVIADVSGKGIPAGLFGMVSKTMLRQTATVRQLSPAALAAEVNDALCADNDTSMFVTAFYGRYEPATGRLTYVNAGHPPPLLLRADGRIEWLPGAGGTAFGVVEGGTYQEQVARLAPGDGLLVFTDGVTEAVDRQGIEFGRDRLAALVRGQPVRDAQHLIERVLFAVGDFARGLDPFDDITCVVLRCEALGEGA